MKHFLAELCQPIFEARGPHPSQPPVLYGPDQGPRQGASRSLQRNQEKRKKQDPCAEVQEEESR